MRMAGKSGGEEGSMVMMTSRGTGNSSISRPAPSQGSSSRWVASRSTMVAWRTPEKLAATLRASSSAVSMSSPSAGLICTVASRAISS
jgi:hypothetical protein